jgi:hypothetical protein
MLKMSRVLALASFAAAAGGCATAAYADDFFAPYFQRKDSVTLSAGNAKAVNAASQIIDPWPRYVGNRRIPANGERMAGAMLRYRDVSRIPRAPQPMNHPTGASGAGGGIGGGMGAIGVGGGGGIGGGVGGPVGGIAAGGY